MSSEINKLMRRKLQRCYGGWLAWRKVRFGTKTNRKNRSTTAFILFPSANREYNYYGLLYLPSYLIAHNYNRVIVAGCDKATVEAAHLFVPDAIRVAHLSETEASWIVDLFSLYRFDKHLIVVDLEHPEGRNGLALVGKRGITVEDMIAVGIYQLYPVRRPSPPRYSGDSKLIKAFLAGSEN